MPTAEEWSALFGASALIALAFAWYQIRQVDASNRALVSSNELARQVNVEAIRPRIQVSLEAVRHVARQRGAPVQAVINIAVRNIGVSPASEVRLRVSPTFESLEEFFKPGMKDSYLARLNAVFNGGVSFRAVNPGAKYVWFLGKTPELFAEDVGIPRRWEVEAEYSGPGRQEPFRDIFFLDLESEKLVEVPVDPIERLGRDLETVGIELKAIRLNIPSELTVSGDILSAIGQHGRKRRLLISRDRREPAWLRRQRRASL